MQISETEYSALFRTLDMISDNGRGLDKRDIPKYPDDEKDALLEMRELGTLHAKFFHVASEFGLTKGEF